MGAPKKGVYAGTLSFSCVHKLLVSMKVHYDAMSVPMAIALPGCLLFGQPVIVKPSEADKNLV